MASERKRFTVVGRQDQQQNGFGSSFSFGEFESGFYPESGTASPSRPLPAGTNGDSSAPASPSNNMYRAKRTSIVDGVSAMDLQLQHRRSLAGLAAADTNPTGVDMSELEGVTLSKRHTYTRAEYDAGRETTKFSELGAFKVGFEDDDGNALQGPTAPADDSDEGDRADPKPA